MLAYPVDFEKLANEGSIPNFNYRAGSYHCLRKQELSNKCDETKIPYYKQHKLHIAINVSEYPDNFKITWQLLLEIFKEECVYEIKLIDPHECQTNPGEVQFGKEVTIYFVAKEYLSEELSESQFLFNHIGVMRKLDQRIQELGLPVSTPPKADHSTESLGCNSNAVFISPPDHEAKDKYIRAINQEAGFTNHYFALQKSEKEKIGLNIIEDNIKLFNAFIQGHWFLNPVPSRIVAFFQLSEQARFNYVTNLLLEAWESLDSLQQVKLTEALKLAVKNGESSDIPSVKSRTSAVKQYLHPLLKWSIYSGIEEIQNIHRKQTQSLNSSKNVFEDEISLDNRNRFVFTETDEKEIDVAGKGKEKESLNNSFSIVGSTFATTNPQTLERENLLNQEKRNGVHDALYSATVGNDAILAIADGLGGHSTDNSENQAVARAAHFGSKHLVELFSLYTNPDELKTDLENETILKEVAAKIRTKHPNNLSPGTALACCRAYQQPDGSMRVIGVGVGDCMIIAYNPDTKQFTNLICAREIKFVGRNFGPISFPEGDYPKSKLLAAIPGALQIVDMPLPVGTILIGMTDGVLDIETNDGKALPTKISYFDNEMTFLGDLEDIPLPTSTAYTETKIDCEKLQSQLADPLEKASTSQDVTVAIAEFAISNIEAKRQAFVASYESKLEQKKALEAQIPEKVAIERVLSEEVRLLGIISEDIPTISAQSEELNKKLVGETEALGVLEESYRSLSKEDEIFRANNRLLELKTFLIVHTVEKIALGAFIVDKTSRHFDESGIAKALAEAKERASALENDNLTEYQQSKLTACMYTIISLSNIVELYKEHRDKDNVNLVLKESVEGKIKELKEATKERETIREQVSQYVDNTRLTIGDDFAIGAIATPSKIKPQPELSHLKLIEEASLSWYQRNKGKIFAGVTVVTDLVLCLLGPVGWAMALAGTASAVGFYNMTGGSQPQQVLKKTKEMSVKRQEENKAQDETAPLLKEEKGKEKQFGKEIQAEGSIQYGTLYLPGNPYNKSNPKVAALTPPIYGTAKGNTLAV
jgi:hypothetical protein